MSSSQSSSYHGSSSKCHHPNIVIPYAVIMDVVISDFQSWSWILGPVGLVYVSSSEWGQALWGPLNPIPPLCTSQIKLKIPLSQSGASAPRVWPIGAQITLVCLNIKEAIHVTRGAGDNAGRDRDTSIKLPEKSGAAQTWEALQSSELLICINSTSVRLSVLLK